MRFNPKARLDTSRVSDRRGGGGSGGGGLGRGAPMRIPGGARAGGGIGGVLVIILLVVLVQCAGGSGLGIPGGSLPADNAVDSTRVGEDTGRYADCTTGADANSDPDCARIAVENSLYDYWAETLPSQGGSQFSPATMTTFSGVVDTRCGQASSQVGPFYCPVDQGIYLDTAFFDQVLEQQLGGPDGGFVEYYVLAHEYGHHIQNLLGTMGRVRTQQGPRSDAVRLELQADCYAGMWAGAASTTEDADDIALITGLTAEDVQLAIEAAESVGDDRIQQKTQGQVTEEAWTHGSAESRAQWFRTGYESGDMQACDTWSVDKP